MYPLVQVVWILISLEGVYISCDLPDLVLCVSDELLVLRLVPLVGLDPRRRRSSDLHAVALLLLLSKVHISYNYLQLLCKEII